MIYNVNELRRDTAALIKQIDAQIAEVQKLADRNGVPVTTLVNNDGSWVMPPLLMAKATAYNTLVLLQTEAPHRGR